MSFICGVGTEWNVVADGVLPMPTTIIFGQPALHRSGEAGVQLDAIEDENAGRFVRVAVHPHVAGRNGADLHHVHRRTDRHAHRFFREAERFDHRPLPFGGAAVVRTHGGEQERPGAVIAEPVAGGPRDCRDIRNPAAAGRDADVALRYLQLQTIELLADCGANIRDRIRDELLVDAKEFHSAGSRRATTPL